MNDIIVGLVIIGALILLVIMALISLTIYNKNSKKMFGNVLSKKIITYHQDSLTYKKYIIILLQYYESEFEQDQRASKYEVSETLFNELEIGDLVCDSSKVCSAVYVTEEGEENVYFRDYMGNLIQINGELQELLKRA